jgi:two-component system OmpR family sensor kinase
VTIRMRVAAVFTIALAAAFALGSWLFLSQLRAVLLQSVDSGLALQLSQAGRLLPSGGSAGPVQARPGRLAPGDYIVQLVDAAGRVRVTSEDAGREPLLTPAEQRQARRGQLTTTTTIDGDPERLMAAPFPARPGWIAVAGVSLEASDETLSAATTRLIIGGTAFVLIAGLGAYALARAALAPVERLRREAAALSARDSSGRLPVPRTHDEISALAGTMNELLGRLHSALARQRAFVADASHELRTPFAVLRGELELAGKPGRSREQLASAVASAADEAARLSRITDDLLLLARSDEDQLTVRAEPTDIGALLARSADLARPRGAVAGVTCRVDTLAGLTAVVDPDRIRQAVDNLIDNALRFSPRGSEIVVSARTDGPDLVIEVADEGPGFPRDYLAHAFERFVRPDRGQGRSDGGAGLGLAIVRAIAQAHGGRATAGNGPAGGAVVRLELPAVVQPAS